MVGLFANGVEAYSYKSSDMVFWTFEDVEVLNTRSDYDVINRLSVTQDGHTGLGASVLHMLRVPYKRSSGHTRMGYEETTGRVVGVNNTTAIAKQVKIVQHEVNLTLQHWWYCNPDC